MFEKISMWSLKSASRASRYYRNMTFTSLPMVRELTSNRVRHAEVEREVVCHGAFMDLLTRRILGLSLDAPLAFLTTNCAIHEFLVERRDGQMHAALLRWSREDHIPVHLRGAHSSRGFRIAAPRDSSLPSWKTPTIAAMVALLIVAALVRPNARA